MKELSGAGRAYEVIKHYVPGTKLTHKELCSVLPKVSPGALSGFLNYAVKRGILEVDGKIGVTGNFRRPTYIYAVKDTDISVSSKTKGGGGSKLGRRLIESAKEALEIAEAETISEETSEVTIEEIKAHTMEEEVPNESPRVQREGGIKAELLRLFTTWELLEEISKRLKE